MQLITFNEALTFLCDKFDELISPRVIARSNTNIIYLIFKAIAKGFEVINNVCVTLSNKFNPLYCSSEDLESVAKLVGTERLKGSASGLHILVSNTSDDAVTLVAGIYDYQFEDDIKFTFEVLQDVLIASGSYMTFIAMSDKIGSYPVTAQTDIEVVSESEISEDLVFSCTDNSSLLGTERESDLAFRKRIAEDFDRQDSIKELEITLRNLPYLFDCRVRFNNTNSTVTYDGIVLPPFTAVIFYAGSVRNEIASIIASKIICPTVAVEGCDVVTYNSDVFASGKQEYYLIPFSREKFSVEIIYKINNSYASDFDFKSKISILLQQAYIPEIHEDYIKEDDIYDLISDEQFSGIDLLGINLKHNGENVNYVTIPISKIPELDEVIFIKEQ